MGRPAKTFLVDTHKNLMDEWDYELNASIDISIIGTSCNKKTNWICKTCKNKWVATVKSRTLKGGGRRCPYCNSLAAMYPALLKEWDYEQNTVLPETVHPHSEKTGYWKCSKGHKWATPIKNRTFHNKGCPYCRHRLLSPENSLLVCNPILSEEWNKSKNGTKTPASVFVNSTYRDWWKCSTCGLEWISSVNNRNKGRMCSACKGFKLKDGSICSSLSETFLYLNLFDNGLYFEHNKVYPTVKDGIGKCRYDFYIPSKDLYIEVTGYSKDANRIKDGFLEKYISKIEKKRKYVESVLLGKFEFVSLSLTKEQIHYIQGHKLWK